MTDLKHIKDRLDAASPGPWRALSGKTQRPATGSPLVYPLVLANNEHILCELSPWTGDGDRDLIVNARRDIELLYNEVEYLRDLLSGIVIDIDDEASTAAEQYLAVVRGAP